MAGEWDEHEMGGHHWDPRPGDERRIREHLERQRGLDPLRRVALDDGRIVDVGEGDES